jgi:chemotaxis protein methyltransferase CheR
MDHHDYMTSSKAELSEGEFSRLSNFIMSEYGIKMPPEKKIMLQSRLQKRLKFLNLSNFSQYIEYLFSPQGQIEEVIHMMDVVSTNKTEFFRESAHFDYLLSEILPELIKERGVHHIKVLSAGCSSGEEPYTIAITLSEFMDGQIGLDFTIEASDISTQMLEKAATAIYAEEKISELPHIIKTKYFLRSKNREEKKVRVIPELRNKVHFYRQNFLCLPASYQPEYDIIFCRNVLIYFDRNNQLSILEKLCKQLKPGGYLLLGHSESITGLELPLEHIKPTIFRKK